MTIRKGESKWFDRLGELHDEEPAVPTWPSLAEAHKFIKEKVIGNYSVLYLHLFRIDKNGKKSTVSIKEPGDDFDILEDPEFAEIKTSEEPDEVVFEEEEVKVPDDLIEQIRQYTALRANAIAYRDQLVSDLAKYDAMQQDILHFIEFEKSTAPERMTIYAKLRDVRQARRKVKNMINVIGAFISETPVLPSETVKQIEILSTLEYKPRELKELFDHKKKDHAVAEKDGQED